MVVCLSLAFSSIAAGVVKQVVDYYTTRGSHVFAIMYR